MTMKRFFLILALLPLLGMGQHSETIMARRHKAAAATGNSHVLGQSCYAAAGSGAGSITCTFPSNAGAGHLLFACFIYTATAPNTYTFSGDSSAFALDPKMQDLYIWSYYEYETCGWWLSSNGGNNFIKVTFTSGTNYGSFIVADEYVCPICSLDVEDTPTSSGGPGTTATTSSITPTTNGDIVIGVFSSQPTSIFTAGAGFTLGGQGAQFADEYIIQSTAASITPTATL